VELRIRLLVTDVGVRAFESDVGDEAVREAVRNAVAWEGARAVEVRDVAIEVELLARPAPRTADAKPVVEVAQDIRELVEAELRRRRREVGDEAWDVLMDALHPGTYEIKRADGMRGMRRLS
jgi:hypothetical protein